MRPLSRGGEPVLVDAYSSGRPDERPMAVLWGLQRHDVVQVLSVELVEPIDKPAARRRRFVVRTEGALVLRLEHTLLTDVWRVTAVLEVLDGEL